MTLESVQGAVRRSKCARKCLSKLPELMILTHRYEAWKSKSYVERRQWILQILEEAKVDLGEGGSRLTFTRQFHPPVHPGVSPGSFARQFRPLVSPTSFARQFHPPISPASFTREFHLRVSPANFTREFHLRVSPTSFILHPPFSPGSFTRQFHPVVSPGNFAR